jgi:ribosome maturation factor RimP
MIGGIVGKSSQTAVEELVAPIALRLKLDVEEVLIRKTGNRQIIRVILDKDGGVSMDEIAAATRAISDELDNLVELASPFTLEVSSPGVDRPLTEVRHWRRNIGRLVKVQISDSGPIEGRILEVNDQDVLLQVKQYKRSLPLKSVERAVVQVEFNKPKESEDGH